MNRRTLLIGAGGVVLALLAWRIIGINSAADVRRQAGPIVMAENPSRETVTLSLRFTGDVLPIQQATIYSKVSGNLERVFADMGTNVRANQRLATIDTTELSQQYMQASASYENARLTYERTKGLAEQNLVAKQTLDNAEAAMKISQAAFEAARTKLEYANIVAPFGGTVTRRFLDPGANITSNTTTLFTLMDISAMKVIVNVLEKDIPLVKTGKRAVVSVDAYPGKEFSGTIARLSDAVDLSTRTMQVEIDIPNPDRFLKPGMFANVNLVVEEHPHAVTVPTQALLRDEKGDFVFVLEDQTAHRRTVKIGTEQNGRTEILSGLAGTEQLVTVGQQFVKDGAAVTLKR